MCVGTQGQPVQPKRCQRVVLTCSPIRKFQTHPVSCQQMEFFFERVEHVHISLVFVNNLTAVFQMD